MKKIEANDELVAACGLYCGSCPAYLKDKCPGCSGNEKAFWCKVRECCRKNNFKTCSECQTFKQADQCPKFNNFFSKVIGFFLNSDRNACINRIKNIGQKAFSEEMANSKKRTIKKR